MSTPADIERNIDHTRDRLDRTLDALQAKLSPGQLLDRWLDYLKRNGGELASNFGERVKQNPLPLLLTSVGVAWLMTTSSRRPAAADETTDGRFGERSRELAAQASERASDLGDRVSDLGEKASERVSDLGERASDAASNAAARVRQAASAAGRRMSDVAQSTRERTRQASEGAARLMREQPLLVGILAMAAGALLGASLPATEAEDRWMGDIRDQSVARARQTAADAYAHARSAAQDALHESAGDSGQTTSIRTH